MTNSGWNAKIVLELCCKYFTNLINIEDHFLELCIYCLSTKECEVNYKWKINKQGVSSVFQEVKDSNPKDDFLGNFT